MKREEQAAEGRVMGQGDWRYEMTDRWAQLPDGWVVGDVAGVAVDAADNVFVFHRGEHPVLVFARSGAFLRSWGEGVFVKPHGISIGADGSVYCTDEGDHTVRKFSPEGRLLLQIGIPGDAAPRFSGRSFNRCTHTTLSRSGDIFVSDGYGNAKVHKYSPDGKLLMSWGEFGTDNGQFNLVHNITSDPDGWVYVADRENHRVQVFDENGVYQSQWKNLHRPCGLCTQSRRQPVSFIGEVGPGLASNFDYPNIGPRISIVDHNGALLSRLGDCSVGMGPTQFMAPHGMAVDSHDDLYVGEVGSVAWRVRYPDQKEPANLPNLKKLVRVTTPVPAAGRR